MGIQQECACRAEATGHILEHMEEPEVWPAMLYQLDSFLTSSDLKAKVFTFALAHSAQFEAAPSDEQPLHTHELYKEFTAMIEAQLESFLADGTVSSAQLFQACKEAKERGDAVPAMDYLLASTEYEGFVQLMIDFKSMDLSSASGPSNTNASPDKPEWA